MPYVAHIVSRACNLIVSKAWESCDDFRIAAPIEGLVMLLHYRPVDLSLSYECLVPNVNGGLCKWSVRASNAVNFF